MQTLLSAWDHLYYMLMRFSLLTTAILLALSGLSCQTNSSAALSNNSAPAAAAKNTGEPAPVLVELYTSEGCSSCPPADRALMVLEQEQPVRGAKIIALELHVDYWDNENWKDPFSSALYSQRQNLYAQKFRKSQVYTPQMIVDGEREFIGSDTRKAGSVIADAARSAKATIALTRDGVKLKIKIDDLQKTDGATVFLALAEDNLDTDIRGGENTGKKLVHSSVVRELRSIGTINSESAGFETEADLQPDKSWKKQDLKAVVFVQENKSRKVLGVGQVSLEDKK